MRKFDFRLADDDALILIEAYIKDYPLILALDYDYDGVLGIDFFRKQCVLTIDFVSEKLWIVSKK